MPEWEYLTTPVFQWRQVLTAHIVHDCLYIVEVGSYKSPISEFVPRAWHQGIILVDPKLETSTHSPGANWDTWVQYSKMTIQEAVHSSLNAILDLEFALVMLGIEIKGNLQPVFNLVEASKKTVIEFPDGWAPSVKQFARIEANTTKKVTMQCQMDFSGNNLGDIKGYPPRYVRNLFVLE